MKRTLAERVAFLMLSAALAVGAWAVTGRAACSVTAPYQFPVQPGTPEWVELSANARRAACRLPAGLAEQMTSEALLETALDYPFNASMYVSSDLEGMFGKRAALAGNGALAELVTRPDAEEVIARALAAPAEAGEDPLRGVYLETFCAWLPELSRMAVKSRARSQSAASSTGSSLSRKERLISYSSWGAASSWGRM